MGETHLGFSWRVFTLVILLYSVTLLATVYSQTSSARDAAVMLQLKKNLNPPSSLGWGDSNPCRWQQVQCNNDGRVTRIQIGNLGLTGSLPMNLHNLTFLVIFEVFSNHLSGPLPSLAGLSSLQRVMLRDNNFSSIPRISSTGRPKGVTPKFSIAPLIPRLSKLLGVQVMKANDCIGPEVEKLVASLPESGALLLENVRFHKEKEKNHPEFTKKLASLADFYVNNAFGTAHRAHASTEGVTKFLKPSVAGFLLQKELARR